MTWRWLLRTRNRLRQKRFHIPKSELDAADKEHDLNYENKSVDTWSTDKASIEKAIKSDSKLVISSTNRGEKRQHGPERPLPTFMEPKTYTFMQTFKHIVKGTNMNKGAITFHNIQMWPPKTTTNKKTNNNPEDPSIRFTITDRDVSTTTHFCEGVGVSKDYILLSRT